MMGTRKTQAQLLGELIVTVNGIADRVEEIKGQLKEGDEKFEEYARARRKAAVIARSSLAAVS